MDASVHEGPTRRRPTPAPASSCGRDRSRVRHVASPLLVPLARASRRRASVPMMSFLHVHPAPSSRLAGTFSSNTSTADATRQQAPVGRSTPLPGSASPTRTTSLPIAETEPAVDKAVIAPGARWRIAEGVASCPARAARAERVACRSLAASGLQRAMTAHRRPRPTRSEATSEERKSGSMVTTERPRARVCAVAELRGMSKKF